MRNYQFDDMELRAILALAYRHGYEDGACTESPVDVWAVKKEKYRRKAIERCHYKMKYGDIVAGQEPEVW
jgi:hypothetical protein